MAAHRVQYRVRFAFTWMESLVCLALLAIVLGLLLPMAGSSRHDARLLTCELHVATNLDALSQYVEDWKGFYPASQSDDPSEPGNVGFYNLLGETGLFVEHAGMPAKAKVLNRYLPPSRKSARCPLDVGFKWTSRPMFQMVGTSYAYPQRSIAQMNLRGETVYSAMWMIEGHHRDNVFDPARKALLFDAIALWEFPENENHAWHNGRDPLAVSMGFADGHVAAMLREPRPAETAQQQPKQLPDVDAVKLWAVNRPYH